MMTKPDATYVVFIMASPQAVWDALISDEVSPLYFFGHRVEVGTVGGAYRIWRPDGALDVDGEVQIRQEPALLRVLWRLVDLPGAEDIQPADIEFQIEAKGEVAKLTVREFHRSVIPEVWVEAGRNGWSLILSGLKTLLETGAPLPTVQPEPPGR